MTTEYPSMIRLCGKHSTFFIFLLFISTALSAQPIVSSFIPSSAPIGATVVITGTGFNAGAANNIVYFGAVKAAVSAATTTSITVTVPVGATYQPISVTANNLTGYSVKPFTVSFGGNGVLGFAAIAPAVDLTTDLHPNGVVIVDLDGDGKADLATANNYSSTGLPASISVLRNTGTPGTVSFSQRADYTTGKLTYAIAAGDLDGDGKPDLAATSISDKTVAIFRNTSTTGNISFATRVDYPTGDNPYSIAISDFDGDGRPDLAVCNYLSNTISLYRNTCSAGIISFAPPTTITTVPGPECIAAGDLNGDGRPDLAVTNNLFNSVSVFPNTGSAGVISFGGKTDYNTAQSPIGLCISDLDGDDKPDLTVANSNSNTVSVLRNTGGSGTMSFTANAPYAVGNLLYFPVAADVNGDGKPDITLTFSNGFSLLQNTSSAGAISLVTKTGYFTSPYGAAVGDLDGDGIPDWVLAQFNSNKVSVFRNRINDPLISSFLPTAAAATDTVTIKGVNFTGTNAVSFGGMAAASFSIVSDSIIKAVVGGGVSGNVSVTNAYNTSTLTGFTFKGAPVITSFTPTATSVDSTVTIQGYNLSGATVVSFGGVAAASFTVVSPFIIKAVVGAGASGDVKVITSYGTGILPGFVLVPTPTVTSFTPTSAGGGTTVTIKGTNFTGATAVSFGTAPARSFTVIDSATITAVADTGASGSIKVTTAYGAAVSAGFTFIPLPVIQSFAPASAITGSTITITGANFTGATAVSLGGVPATSFTVRSATSITAIVGPGASGNISLVTPGGTASLAGFVFIPPPVISSFTPAKGPTGTVVTISGTNFNTTAAGNTVYFGPVKATVTSATPTALTVLVPAGAGYFPLTVTANGLTAFSRQPFIVLFQRDTTAFKSNTFSKRTDFTGGGTPYYVLAADIDGDGRPDLVVPDMFNRKVSVLRNTGTAGTLAFAPQVSFDNGGWQPYGVLAVDMDGDGRKDIVVSNNGPGVSVFRNTSTAGNISFALPVYSGYFGVSIAVAEGDFDSDGRPDLVVLANGQAFILQNTSGDGTISLAAGPSLPLGPDNWSVAAADLDGDGKPDVIASNRYANSVTVYRNAGSNGVVSFGPRTDYTVGANPYRVLTGDMNNDGKPEIIALNNNSVSILKNNSTPGTLSFAAKTDFPAGVMPQAISIGDMDGDGKTDILTFDNSPNGTDRGVQLIQNTGSSGNIVFAAPVANLFKNNPILQAAYLADFNGDDKPDLVLGQDLSTIVSIMRNTLGEKQVTACAGDTIALASATTGASYQWQVNTGSGFSNITDNNSYTGTNSATLLINNLPFSSNGSQYRCQVNGNNGLVTLLVLSLAAPSVTATGPVLTVSVPDTLALYKWQVQGPNGVWSDVSPAASGVSYTATVSGTYRVQANKGTCRAYSNAQNIVITAISPVPASALGIHVYPNPAVSILVLDSLNLSDRWETIDIMGMEGRLKMSSISLRNQTSIVLSVESLERGMYIALLRRKNGANAVIKFIKL